MEKDKRIRLGDGVSDGLKNEVNQELLDVGKNLVSTFFAYLNGKVQNIDWDKIFSPKDKKELASLWAYQLAQEEMIPKGYTGLPDNLLVDNLHQDGYLSGLYAGYVLAMMSLVDNNAPDELILAVRDELRPNLIRHHYNDRDEFYNRYKDEKYKRVERLKSSNTPDQHT